MRYKTEKGFVTAKNRHAAAVIAAQYGLGDIVGIVPSPPRRRMSLNAARKLFAQADEWPRCGQGWPETSREREAAAVLESAGELLA